MENSKISWTHHTFNPWEGCTKVSPACDNCYAERDRAIRRKTVVWGAGQPRRRMKTTWNKPPRWNKQAEETGEKVKVFCASLADVFDGEKVSDLDAWRKDLWKLIEDTPNLYWLLLTKRPQNVMRMVPDSWQDGFPEHVWMGTSTENQEWLDRRVPILLEIPATVRFLSCEPLLGPLDFRNYLRTSIPVTDPSLDAPDGAVVNGMERVGETWERREGINWIIAGGESGPGWRPMDMDWVRDIRDQCVAADVPFFLKQTSGNHPIKEPVLDGRQWMECPEERFAVTA